MKDIFASGGAELDGLLKSLETQTDEGNVATKKKKAPKKAAKPKKPAMPSQQFIEEDLAPCRGPFVKGGFATESIKLKGKDELLIAHCAKCKASHYYLAQPDPENDKRFNIHELLTGEAFAWVPRTPSGDMDTEGAIEHVEDEVDEH